MKTTTCAHCDSDVGEPSDWQTVSGPEEGEEASWYLHICSACGLLSVVEGDELRRASSIETTALTNDTRVLAAMVSVRCRLRRDGRRCEGDDGDLMPTWEAAAYGRHLMMHGLIMGGMPLDKLATHLRARRNLDPQTASQRDKTLGIIRAAQRLSEAVKSLRESFVPGEMDSDLERELRDMFDDPGAR